MARMLVITLCFIHLVFCVNGNNGTFCSQQECEYNVFKKLIKLEETVASLTETLEEFRSSHDSQRSASYIRWGRTSCPSGATLVYDGYLAGSHYTHRGAAADALCLTKEPRWSWYTSAVESAAFIYGAEYQFAHYPAKMDLHNHNVPCAVCRVPQTDILMIPGTTSCPTDYRLQYRGYLMAGRHTHEAASENLCIDGSPETIYGGHEDEDGYLLYYVQARCGSLNCPPYINGREVTCAVCSFSPG